VGKPPTGRSCLVETNLLKEWTLSFIYEYDVHPESLTDRIAVQELAEIELLLYRINSNLAKLQYGELVAESVSSVTPRGDVIYEEKVVPLMDLKLRLQARRDRVIKSLVGDRESQYKKRAALKQIDTEGDASSKGATLRHQLEKLQREVLSFSERVEKENNTEEGIIVVAQKESNQILETTAEKVMQNQDQIEKEKEILKKREDEKKLSPEEFMMEQFTESEEEERDEEDHSDE